MNKKTLDEIALECGTDKSSADHNFTRWYDEIFSPLRIRKCKLLEIGIYKGESLKMWDRYFDQAEIYGMDIKDCKEYDNMRITTIIGDQANKHDLLKVSEYGPFDIIIDDGGHTNLQQIVSFETLFEFVKPGGYYVIEDLHTSYIPGFIDKQVPTAINYLKDIIDDLNLHGKPWCGDKYKLKKEDLENFEDIESMIFYKSICFIRKMSW